MNEIEAMMQGWHASHSRAIPPIVNLKKMIDSMKEYKTLNNILDIWTGHIIRGTSVEYSDEDLKELKSWHSHHNRVTFMDDNYPGAHNHHDAIKRSLLEQIMGVDK